MNRKNFLKNSLLGFGAIVALPTVINSCSSDDSIIDDSDDTDTGSCSLTPSETEGPYPIRTPSQLVLENIVSDRTGVALLLTLTVQDRSNNCEALSGVYVDVWMCDKDGNYSQYGNYTNVNFLRGRQLTDSNGQVSFISIFPGWYQGRAPHIHVEVLSTDEDSLLVSQIAFPESVYSAVYNSDGYNGAPDTSNDEDDIFADSLDGNMANSVTGNITDGYTLLKTLVV